MLVCNNVQAVKIELSTGTLVDFLQEMHNKSLRDLEELQDEFEAQHLVTIGNAAKRILNSLRKEGLHARRRDLPELESAGTISIELVEPGMLR